MNARHVQRVVTAANAQKAGALLEGLGTQAGHFEQILPGFEHAIGIAPAHHRLGHAGRQARHAGEQGDAGRVQVHAHRVHAVFHHRVQRLGQLALVHVVLVLAHTNRFGVDLDQLRQGVLQAAGNGCRAAQAHVHVGHFLAGKFTGGVHRSTRLADHDFRDFHPIPNAFSQSGQLLDQVTRQLVGLAAGSAVANGDQVDVVFFAELGQGEQRALPVFARFVRVDRGGVDQLAGGIHHGHLHARADTRVQAHDHAGACRSGQQQVAQVVSKDLDGDFFGLFSQAGKQIPLSGQAQFHAPSPSHAFTNQVIRGTGRVAPAQMHGDLAFGDAGFAGLGFHRKNQLGVQHFQSATTEHSQSTV